ncbi:MAG: hypothetical protein RI973_568 [Bacteroidota bacterium]|jgi:hypothetical protein
MTGIFPPHVKFENTPVYKLFKTMDFNSLRDLAAWRMALSNLLAQYFEYQKSISLTYKKGYMNPGFGFAEPPNPPQTSVQFSSGKVPFLKDSHSWKGGGMRPSPFQSERSHGGVF